MSEPSGALGVERVLVVGAGSLGTLYGAFLARAGFDVQLLARESHARAVQEAAGVWLESFGERSLVSLRAQWRPELIEPAEILIMLAKVPDTESALAGLEHVRDTLRLAVSLQNGVEKDRLLAAWAGEQAVVGGVSMVGGTLIAPGVARHTFIGPTYLGELPVGSSPRVQRLGAMLQQAGLQAIVTDRVLSAEWSKLAHAVAPMALSALTRLYYHEILLAPELADLFVQLVRESVAVAGAAGVEVDDWPSMLPVRTVAAMPDAEAAALVHELGRSLHSGGMTEVKISMLQSVERRRKLEVGTVHGFLAREAARLGVAAPAVEVCYRLLAGMDRYHR